MECTKKEKNEKCIILKWVDKIICDIFLGVYGILILVGIYYLIKMVKTPPPEVNDMIYFFTILIPVLLIFLAGIIVGIVYHGKVAFSEIYPFKKRKKIDLNITKKVKNEENKR